MGNPYTDFIAYVLTSPSAASPLIHTSSLESYYPMLCTTITPGLEPVLGIKECVHVKTVVRMSFLLPSPSFRLSLLTLHLHPHLELITHPDASDNQEPPQKL